MSYYFDYFTMLLFWISLNIFFRNYCLFFGLFFRFGWFVLIFDGGLYNIGSGEANTWVNLVTPIFEALDKKVDIEFIDMPVIGKTINNTAM